MYVSTLRNSTRIQLTNDQVQGMRSQHASDARAAVMQRSAAIRKIEQDLITLAELSQEVAELVHQQEHAVVEIDKAANETHTNFQEANNHLEKGIRSVRNARKLKWWALFICSEYFSNSCPELPLIYN